MRRLRSAGAVAVQLLALLSLHLWGVAPHAVKLVRAAVHPTVCRGVHAECGCSPERIASRACCCYERLSPCCVEACNQGDAERREDGESRRLHALSVLPCGDTAKDLGPTVDATDLATSEPPSLPKATAIPAAPLRALGVPPDRAPEPPEPPPKALLPA